MEKIKTKLLDGFVRGIGWAFGVTLGFVLVSTVVVYIFRALGGLPLIGDFIATVVEETNKQLLQKTPVL